jgi:hypothetical protein
MTARGPRFGDASAYHDPYDNQPYPSSAAPSYRSPAPSDTGYSAAAPAFRPSEIYGRPSAPSDVWVDDSASTIVPGVRVRLITGRSGRGEELS